MLAAAGDSLHVVENALFRRLWACLRRGDVVLGDRGFCSWAQITLLLQRGVDCVLRLHQRRKTDFRTGERLGRRDHIAVWKKPRGRPPWVTRELYLSLPNHLVVREMEITLTFRGFRTKKLRLVTTILDAKRFPKSAFGALYMKRWRAELFLRDIKSALGADVLRCKTPAMVRRELWMHLIDYNLVRTLMARAARHHRADPMRLSFRGTLDAIRAWTPHLGALAHKPRRLGKMVRLLLYYIARDLVPHRPCRAEPRAKKRRPKNYQLLTKPRHLVVDIPHRNRYKKPLS